MSVLAARASGAATTTKYAGAAVVSIDAVSIKQEIS